MTSIRCGNAPGQAAWSPTAMLTPSMDRKNSSSAHIIASMSVCTRMPGTLVSTSCAGFAVDVGAAFGVDDVDQPAVRAGVRGGHGCGGGLAAAGAGRDEQVRFLVFQVGDPFPAASEGGQVDAVRGQGVAVEQGACGGAGGCRQVAVCGPKVPVRSPPRWRRMTSSMFFCFAASGFHAAG